MAEVQVHRNLYLDPNQTYTDENGDEQFGVYRLGIRDPESHRVRFEDAERVQADAPATDEVPEHLREQVTVVKDEKVHPSAVATPSDNPIQATEAAERKAEELGVDLASVEGTGSDDRITAADVEGASTA